MTTLIKIIELAKELDAFFAYNSESFDIEITQLCQKELIDQLKKKLETQSLSKMEKLENGKTTVDGSLVENLKISSMSILQIQSRDRDCPYTPLLTHYLVSLFESHLLSQLKHLIMDVIPSLVSYHVEQ